MSGILITTRSRISVRWSTDPSDMGYGRTKAPDRLAGRPSYVGSPRTALEYVRRVRNNVGQGTYIRIEYTCRGRRVEQWQIDDALLMYGTAT